MDERDRMTESTQQPDVVAANELFCKNMAALWQTDPELAVRIDRVPDERRLETQATRSGQWTAAVTTPEGQSAYLNSRYDPEAEAAKLAQRVEVEDNFCFVVSGFGLGYHVKALLDRLHGEAFVIVSEPSLETLSTALTCVDLSDYLARKRLIILDRIDKAQLHGRLTTYTALMMLGLQFVSHPPSERVAVDFHRQMRQVITDFVAFSRTSMVTLVHNAQITCRNIAYNLPVQLATPPIDALKGRFKGHPGIIIAAGPSLRKNIDLLAAAKGKAVLAAVQTAFKPLLTHGIVPDFVTSLDFHEMSRRYFQGIDDFHGVRLIAEPKCTWHVLDTFDGPMSLLDSSFSRLLIGDALAGRDGLPPGATVAHLAFYLIRYLGCNPIIFVGQDLAYSGHVFYVPGVEVHQSWRGEINRFNTMETKEWERIVRNRAILRTVPDIHGQEVYTDELLFTYLEQFEKDFIGTSARLIDATEGGARLRGTEVMPLAQVLETFCGTDIPADKFTERSPTREWNPAKLPAARREIQERLGEVQAIQKLCVQFLEVLKQLGGLTNDPARFNRKLVRVDALRSAVQSYDRAYRIINSTCQLAELRRYSADRKLGADEASGVELAKRQLKRDLEFVKGMQQGAKDTAGILTETLARFDLAMEQEGPA